MESYKKVIVVINGTTEYDITQTMWAEFPQNEKDLRKSGGYSNVGIEYEIKRGSKFFEVECEFYGHRREISRTEIENPTVEKIRELDIFPFSLKQW